MRIDWRDLLRHFLYVLAFCSVIAVLTTTIWPRRGYLSQFGYAACVGTVMWVVIEFGRHVVKRPSDHGWPHGWRGLLLTGVGIACGYYFGTMLAEVLFGDGVVPSPRDNTISWIITGVAGVSASFFFHARGKQAALAAQISAAERDAAEAKLKLLETQLEPHMLFNTLANLRVLITTDPPRAVAMLDRLNSYLRVTLSGSRALSHPLASEFDRLADYLALMSVRMGDRLRYTLDLPDELRAVPVPPLLLQPLVENAIRHGLEPKVEGGEIVVRARREGELLSIEVADTGVGLDAAPATEGTRFGLAQVRERLTAAHGTLGAMNLMAAPAGGVRATVTFPLKNPVSAA